MGLEEESGEEKRKYELNRGRMAKCENIEEL
jgi:hypothetical protein